MDYYFEFKNGVTPINDTNLNKMQEKIKESAEKSTEELQNLIEEVQNSIDTIGTFSSTEIKTGEKWIDGKPIYRRTFTRTGAGNISLAGLNIDKIFFDFSNSYLCMSNPERKVPLTVITVATAGTPGARQAGVYIENNNLTIEKGEAVSLGECVVTIRYTKTTDTAET